MKKSIKGVTLAVIDNVLKKYSKKGITKKVSVSLKLTKKLNDDLEYLSKHLGISKSKLIEDIIEASGLSKKVDELKANSNTKIDADVNINNKDSFDNTNSTNNIKNENNTNVSQNLHFSNFR